MNKFHNRKTVVGDLTFASKKEASRYIELCLLERAGKISELKTQVPFELVPKQQGERNVRYIADFVYQENGKQVVEDVKGKRTPEYILKRKLMLERHGIRIKEV